MFKLLEILAGVLVIGYISYFIYGKGYDSADLKWKVKWEQVQIEQQTALAKAKDEVRNEEKALQLKKDKAIEDYVKTISDLQKRNSILLSERTGLRSTISSITDSDSKAVTDLGTCRTTANALGVLLGKADERAERDAGELESLNSSVTLLLNSWPK